MLPERFNNITKYLNKMSKHLDSGNTHRYDHYKLKLERVKPTMNELIYVAGLTLFNHSTSLLKKYCI